MFVISRMFYMFGFERPPPPTPPPPQPPPPRSNSNKPFYVIRHSSVVVLLFRFLLLLFGVFVSNRAFTFAIAAVNNNNNNNNNNSYHFGNINFNTDNNIINSFVNDQDNQVTNDYDEDGAEFNNDDDGDEDDEFIIDQVSSSYDLYRLKQKLLLNYDRDSRPIYNSFETMKVYFRLKFVQINHLDDVYQVMTSTVQLEMSWRDEYLTWNSSLYSNSIAFDPGQIWTPDVTLSNNLNSFKYETPQESYVVPYGNNIFDFSERVKYFVSVMPDGECHWTFPVKLISVCQFNLDEFPFDHQECYLDFRSSAYLNPQLVLLKWDTGLDLKLLKEGEFQLLDWHVSQVNRTHIFNVNLDAASSHVCFKLVMKRKIIFYLNKIVLPYFVFYIVTAFTYALPVEAGEKKSYSTSILISAMIYLKDISNFIPKTSVMPLLTIYFNLNLVLVFICIALNTLVYMFYYFDKLKVALPHCVLNLISSSRYFTAERAFATTHKLFDSTEVKSSVAHINKQLAKIKRNLTKCESYLFSLKAAGNSSDYLANDMLSLLITLKIFIVNHNSERGGASGGNGSSGGGAAVDICQDEREWKMASDCYGGIDPTKSSNRDVIDKLNRLDQKRLNNFHFINTLENLKLRLVKYRANEGNSSFTIRDENTNLPRTLSLRENCFNNNSNNNNNNNNVKSSTMPYRYSRRRRRQLGEASVNGTMPSRGSSSRSSQKPSQISKPNDYSQIIHHHHHYQYQQQHRQINQNHHQKQPNLNESQHHHRHHHRHRSHHRYRQKSAEPPTTTLPPPTTMFVTSQSVYNSSSSLNNADRKSTQRAAMTLLETLGEYKFQIKSYMQLLERSDEASMTTTKHVDHMHRRKNLHLSRDHSYVHEWKYFAIILDRIVLIFFAIVTPIFLILMYLRIILLD